jgi:uncharacterized Rossmann fold enzyme
MNRKERRAVNGEWAKVFADIRFRTAKYGDELLRIDTIEMYEGPETPKADMIVVCNVLEYVINPDDVLRDVNLLARKSVLITVKPDSLRDESTWRSIIERRLSVCDWYMENGSIVASCNPGMKVQGVKVSGALSDEDRWDHIAENLKLTDKRIETAPAHDRRAIICGYGPSIRQTWARVKEEREQEDATLISVSGSHDFLISNGVMPDIHVECDPRPHKTQNLTNPQDGVKYLIASHCHSSYFDNLSGRDVRLWHVAVSEHIFKLIDEMGEKRETIVSGGGSVGLRSISLMYALGYRNFSIYGMDCSFENDGHDQWAGPHAGKRQELCKVKCGDEIFISSPVLVTYAGGFFDIVNKLPNTKYRVYGDGLLPAMCRLYSSHTQLEAA